MEIGLEALIDPKLRDHVEESRKLNAELAAQAAGQPEPDLSSVAGARAAREKLAESARERDPDALERGAEAEGRRVPVRVLAPSEGESRATFLDIHGGGFCLGAAARGDVRNRRLADRLGVTVVSVDYRLAPEHPWPAAPEDCETATLWALEQAGASLPHSPLLIGGRSAGGTLAITTLFRLRDRGLLDRVAGVVLQFGSYDLSARTPAGRVLAGESFVEAYVGHLADRTDPDVSPIFGDLHDLPPAQLVVGTEDLLFEDSLAMAARLSAAGGRVDLRVYPESGHGFTAFSTAMAAAAARDIESWMDDRLRARQDSNLRLPPPEGGALSS